MRFYGDSESSWKRTLFSVVPLGQKSPPFITCIYSWESFCLGKITLEQRKKKTCKLSLLSSGKMFFFYCFVILQTPWSSYLSGRGGWNIWTCGLHFPLHKRKSAPNIFVWEKCSPQNTHTDELVWITVFTQVLFIFVCVRVDVCPFCIPDSPGPLTVSDSVSLWPAAAAVQNTQRISSCQTTSRAGWRLSASATTDSNFSFILITV